MSLTGNNVLGSSGYRTNQPPYEIDQSVRFDDGDSPKLTRTPGSAGNLKTWTISAWVKRGNLSDGVFISAGTYSEIKFSSDTLYIGVGPTNSTQCALITSAVYRDPSAWYHIVVHADTPQASSSDRLKLYVNGEEVTAFSTDQRSLITQDVALTFTGAYEHRLGVDESSAYFDGYLAEVNFIDGQALTPSSFGDTDSTTNQWKPIEYTGSYGTNGFYQTYSGTQDGFTKCLMHMDGADGGTTFTDSSTVGSTISVSGSTHTDTSVKKIGTAAAQFDGTGDYLTIPANSAFAFTAGNTQTSADQGTIEAWAYFNNTASSHEQILCGGSGSSKFKTWELARNSSGYISGRINKNSSPWYKAADGSTTIPASTWVHMAMVRQGDDMRLYLNGVQDAVTTGVSTHNDYNSGATYPFYVGAEGTNNSEIDGYIDELRISSNCRYPDGTTFTPRTTAWSDTSIGVDSSGNENDFAASGLVATDQMKDSPSNNFATLNPLDNYYADSTFSEGNLKIVTALAGYAYNSSTISMSSGKWYCEFLVVADARGLEYLLGGISAGTPTSTTDALGTSADSYAYMGQDGNKRNNNSDSSYGNIYGLGDIVGIALDLENNKLYFSKNGTWQDSGDPTSGATGTGAAFTVTSGEYRFCISDYDAHASYNNTLTINFGQDSSFAGEKTAQGNQDDNGIGDFYYDVPAGYLALCTSNLPAPEIADPTAQFNSVLYTGNQTTNAITGVGFQPDWLWVKNRTTSGDYPVMVDAVRGKTKVISSASTSAEWTDSTAVTSFDSDGFTLGNATTDWNRTGGSFVAWNWKGDGVSGGTLNEEGTIDSQVNANTTAGFSIVSYTGQVAAGTVGHGLSEAPELVIGKPRNVTDAWRVGSDFLTSWVYYLKLNDTVAETSYSAIFNSTAPTADVFSVGTDGLNGSASNTYIAYCFHSVEGYSKIGTYVGNGNADGPFIYCGFRPAYLMTKQTSTTGSWTLHDNKRDIYNPLFNELTANESAAEGTSDADMDFTSNGVKIRRNSGQFNSSGATIIYMAFAESPFKTANAR